MKKSKKILAISLALIFAFSTVTISADAMGARSGSLWGSIWDSVVGFFTGDRWQDKDSGSDDTTEVYYAEGARAGIALNAAGEAEDGIRYFDSTLFNYNTELEKVSGKESTINQDTAALDYAADPNGDEWKGIYFTNGGGGEATYTIQGEESYTELSGRNKPSYDDLLNRNSESWKDTGYYYQANGNYYPLYAKRSSSSHIIYSEYTYSFAYQDEQGTPQTIRGNFEISSWYSPSSSPSFKIYKKETGGTRETRGYAEWNKWTGYYEKPYNYARDQYYKGWIYGGLVEDELNEEGQIQFKYPEAGIFDESDESNKDVFTDVNVPFTYEDGYYTLDAQVNNVCFEDGVGEDGATMIQTDPMYDSGRTNALPNGRKGFYPFNDNSGRYAAGSSVNNPLSDPKYHFGMSTAVEFDMTSDGKDSHGRDITFTFAGDDDVWVFIDGQLVLDLGGVHDSVTAELNFAQNTAKMYITDQNSGYTTGDASKRNDWNYEGGKEVSLQPLFNTNNQVGTLRTTLESFAGNTGGREHHTLQIFYLERGQGSSNCRITFNLPVRDAVEVTKDVQFSEELTEQQWAAINETDFRFQLNTIGGNNETSPVGNTYYSVYEGTTFQGVGQTDENGWFTLRNGQTARFYYDDGELGRYKVIEEQPSTFFHDPNWTWSYNTRPQGTSTGFETGITTESVRNILEAGDTVSIVCTNTLNPPFALANDETVVLDYGKSVIIDALANDTQFSTEDGAGVSNLQLTGILNEPANGKAEIVRKVGDDYEVVSAEDLADTNNTEYRYIRYTPTTYMSSIDKVQYQLYTTVDVDPSEEGVSHELDATTTVIPATSVYYEEDFLKNENETYINFGDVGSGVWEQVGESNGMYQEEGRVGTADDSPYGSDVSYLTGNTGDSNGTSYHVNSGEGVAPYFTYKFTGTGTTIFARTSNETGYIRVRIYNEDKELVTQTFVDTVYMSEDPMELYNIPVYNYNGLDYGTYTVDVTVSGTTDWLDRTDFYLDGIRVYNPLNPDELGGVAQAAYRTDGELDADVVELRDKLLDNETTTDDDGNVNWIVEGSTVFTDSNGEIKDPTEYELKGPKNEVYLSQGQSITFRLMNWFNYGDNNVKFYIGAKTPEGGEAQSVTMYVNGTPITVNSTVDCYYDITDIVTKRAGSSVDQTVTIQLDENAQELLSLTNLKVTGYGDYEIINPPADGQE